jgi:hypothetical protein
LRVAALDAERAATDEPSLSRGVSAATLNRSASGQLHTRNSQTLTDSAAPAVPLYMPWRHIAQRRDCCVFDAT